MRSTRFILSLLLVCMVLCTLVACGSNAPSNQTQGGQGASADESAPEPRFAVFSPAIGVMLRDLGFEDDIVGRHSFDTALSESIPVVGSHIEIDDEMLIEVEPTILIFQRGSVEIPERITALAKERGWTIWTYQLESLDDIANTLDDLYLKLVGFPADANSDNDPTTFEVDPTKRFDIELPSARLARAWSPMGRDAQVAGRALLLAGTDPAGALGPGSFHAQLAERLGITNALTSGGMWQELDLEDIVELAPDSILIFDPSEIEPMIGEPEPITWAQVEAALGPIASLPIPAVESRRVGIIDHPQALLPSSTLAQVADEIRKTLAAWRERDGEP
ncbi:MAG: ABC transporter substrate-binding protein [Phycisphaerales bacterium JB052]